MTKFLPLNKVTLKPKVNLTKAQERLLQDVSKL